MAPTLRYFIVRPATEVTLPSGEVAQRPETIVPLIPVDLVPEGIDIRGIPRQLSLYETMGMTHVGTGSLDDDQADHKLIIKQQTGGSGTAASIALPAQQVDDASRLTSSMATMAISPRGVGAPLTPQSVTSSPASTLVTPNTPGTTPEFPPRRPFNTAPEHTGSPTMPPRRRRSSSRSASDEPEEPLHCQPWCHHGTCPRGDICRSKHEMPASLEGLKKVGLEKLPYWYSSANRERRQWQNRHKDGWVQRKQMGRGMHDSSPLGASHWHPRQQHRVNSHEDRVRAENMRARELMNRDIHADWKEPKREPQPEVRANMGPARDHQDLISLDCADALPHAVMDGANK